MLPGGQYPLLGGELGPVLVHIADGDAGGLNHRLIMIMKGDVRGIGPAGIHGDGKLAVPGEGVALRHLTGVRRHRVGARIQGALLGGELLVILIHIVDKEGGGLYFLRRRIRLGAGQADIEEIGGQGFPI